MSWLQIIHETTYRYKKAVRFGPYRLVLRPREGHDVRIEQIRVEIEPEFELPLHDVGKVKEWINTTIDLPVVYDAEEIAASVARTIRETTK